MISKKLKALKITKEIIQQYLPDVPLNDFQVNSIYNQMCKFIIVNAMIFGVKDDVIDFEND